jgi:pimeloyl-ACP methyl ester carboxylesterase
VEKSLRRGACTLCYELAGPEDAQAVVLVHGFGLDRRMWAPQRPALTPYRTLLVDMRGHGQSRPCAGFSVAAAAADLAAIVQAEQMVSPLLVGLSAGGYVVQEYSWQTGGAAGYLVAGATPLFMRYPPWERLALRSSGAILRTLPWPLLRDWIARSATQTPAARETVAALIAHRTRREFLESWQALVQCLHEETMQFDAPLAVVFGEHDRNGTIRLHADKWPRLYPGATVNAVPGAAHMVNLDAPARFNDLMLDFIARCTAAEPAGV